LILDLNGDGVRTQSIASGVKFDLFADGQSINTGWVSGGDGLLVLDRNHDGTINDGSELFGSSTKLANGKNATDGYAALRELDTNHDGIISNTDASFGDLRVWVDSNSDGISQSGEMHTLQSLDIASIDLTTTAGLASDNGNLLGITSNYQTTDGQTHAVADVWFAADKDGTNAKAGTLDAAIASLIADGPPVAGQSIAISSLGASSSLSTKQAETAVVPVIPGSVDLRTRVTSLAQAIGSFGATGLVAESPSSTQLDTSGTLPVNSAPALAVLNMVDVMRQFDANGNQIANPAAIGSATNALSVPGLKIPAQEGVLVGGGKG
jgi:hypothetical protein